MKILVIDNYDSFVYNIVYLLKTIKEIEIQVVKNDHINLEEVRFYDRIIISPGPGLPKDNPAVIQLIKQYATTKHLLGICLGHQAIGQFFKADLQQMSKPLHGVSTPLNIVNQDTIFNNIDQGTLIGHYHSWVLKELPECLKLLATDSSGNIMAFEHKNYNITGLQFHPESILTPQGKQMLENWLNNN
ncbi:anthranilate synthase component II [Myroides sp. LJL119]